MWVPPSVMRCLEIHSLPSRCASEALSCIRERVGHWLPTQARPSGRTGRALQRDLVPTCRKVVAAAGFPSPAGRFLLRLGQRDLSAPSWLSRESRLGCRSWRVCLAGTGCGTLRVYVWCWAWPLPGVPGGPPCGCPRSWGAWLSARKSPAFSPGICHRSPGSSGLLTSSHRSVPNLIFLLWPFFSPICARPFSRHVCLSCLPTICLGLPDRVPSGPERNDSPTVCAYQGVQTLLATAFRPDTKSLPITPSCLTFQTVAV